MTHIVEYIGKDKLIHSEHTSSRASKPHPGDIVDFGDNTEYPFTHGKYGRIDSLNFCDTGTIQVCCEMGSCFLGENYVNISGGPFSIIMPDELESTYELHVARFWNWGNHSSGAGKGIDYYLARPVFRLKKRTPEDEARVKKAFES